MPMFKAFLDPLARTVRARRWVVWAGEGAAALPDPVEAKPRLDIDLQAMESLAAAALESQWLTQPAVVYVARRDPRAARH